MNWSRAYPLPSFSLPVGYGSAIIDGDAILHMLAHALPLFRQEEREVTKRAP